MEEVRERGNRENMNQLDFEERKCIVKVIFRVYVRGEFVRYLNI